MSERLPSGDTFVIDPSTLCLCGNHATQWLEVHALDYCSEYPTAEGLRCDVCTKRFVKLLEDALPMECGDCLFTFVTLSDMIVRQCPINERPRSGS